LTSTASSHCGGGCTGSTCGDEIGADQRGPRRLAVEVPGSLRLIARQDHAVRSTGQAGRELPSGEVAWLPEGEGGTYRIDQCNRRCGRVFPAGRPGSPGHSRCRSGGRRWLSSWPFASPPRPPRSASPLPGAETTGQAIFGCAGRRARRVAGVAPSVNREQRGARPGDFSGSGGRTLRNISNVLPTTMPSPLFLRTGTFEDRAPHRCASQRPRQ
jgi:hypothetical protein